MARTITRRMNDIIEGLSNEFKGGTREEFERQMKNVEKCGNKSNRGSELAKLEKMFDACKINYEKGKDNKYYSDLIAKSNLLNSDKYEEKIIYELFKMYSKYPSPREYMLRLVDTLSEKEDEAWKSDTLRLRILKQFIKYGNYLNDTDFSGKREINCYVKNKLNKRNVSKEEILVNLDDGIFNIPDTATEEQKENDGKYGLIKAADDIAKANFRTNGGEKCLLYYFALAFGMTYFNASKDIAKDEKKDIEINLFRDYYNSDLINKIIEGHFENTGKIESPSGQGINYKNFAEMIYLYYIAMPDGKSVEEKIAIRTDKIKKSYQMVNRVKISEQAQKENSDKKKSTNIYRSDFNNRAFKLDENSFEKYICENYNCHIPKNTGVFQVEAEQKTAFNAYNEIIEKTKSSEYYDDKFSKYGLYIDVNITENQMKKICAKFTDDKELFNDKSIGKFLWLLKKTDELLKNADCQNPQKITRADIIGAIYYSFNQFNLNHSLDSESNNNENVHFRNFSEVWNEFREWANIELEKALYQPLNGKSIFDVLIVFSSYIYLSDQV